ncbi:MAG: YbfB/YjiJ family MFS transporter [Actinomycetia bacterium]|nr:YbfB/YjiJ family MFS transporter [Actinomycetes bacterium]
MKIRGLAAIGVLGLGAAVAQAFGRFAYGVLLPAVRDDLSISNTVAGSLGTINVGAYLAGTVAVAAAASRFRLLSIMRFGLVTSTLGLTLSAVATGPDVLAVAMFLSGFGGAIVWIPTPAIAAGSVAPERRSLAIALLGSGIGLGVVFVSQLTSIVRSSLGDESWRTAYVVMALIAVVTTSITVLSIDHDQAPPAGGKSQLGGFATLRRMRGWFPLTVTYTAFGLMYLLVMAFLVTRLEDDNGWTSSDASLTFTLVGLATVVGGPLFIALAGRVGPALSLAVAFGAWTILVLIVLPGWWAPTLAASAGLGLVFSGVPSMVTLYVVANTSVEDYGPSFAAATLCFGVAQMLSPQLGGLVADLTGSFLLVFLLSSAVAVIGLVAALGLPRTVSEPPAATPVRDLG